MTARWAGLGRSPWMYAPASAFFAERRERSRPDDVHLTPSQMHGVLPQADYVAISGNRVVLNERGQDAMRHVEPDDFVSHLRSFQGGFELSRLRGKVSAAYTVLKPSKLVWPDFFRFLFKSSLYIQGLQTTTDQLRDGQSIRWAEFKLLDLPLIEIGLQRRIALYLREETKEIDAFIHDQERFILLLMERRSANIRSAVTPPDDSEGWIRSRVRFHARISTGSGDTQDAVIDGGYPFYVRSESALRSSRWEFDGDAVLTAGDGAGVGKVFHRVSGRFMAHQRVYVLDRFSGVDPDFFFFAFSSTFAEVALEGRAKSTVDSVRRPMISNLPLYLPPMAEQRRVVARVVRENSRIDATIADVRRAIDLTLERRAALISAAVTGRIHAGTREQVLA